MVYVPVQVTDEQLAAFEAEHEDILVLRGGERSPWTYVLRRPTRQETIGYKQHAKKDASTASEALVRRIVLFPNAGDLDKQINRWAFSVDAVVGSDAFQEFIGLAVSDQLKG